MMLDRIDGLTARSTGSPPGSRSRSPPTAARWSSWMRSPASGSPPRRTDRRNRNRHEPLPTAGHLVSWGQVAPSTASSAGKSKAGSTGKATPGSPPPLARSSPQPPGPTPSSARGTTASPAAAQDADCRRGQLDLTIILAPALRPRRQLPRPRHATTRARSSTAGTASATSSVSWSA